MILEKIVKGIIYLGTIKEIWIFLGGILLGYFTFKFSTLLIFAILGLIGFGYLFVNPTFGVLAVLGFIPVGILGTLTEADIPVVLSLIRFLGMGAAGAWAINTALKKTKLTYVPMTNAIILFGTIAFVSFWFATSKPAAFGALFIIVNQIVYYFLVVNTIKTEKLLRAFIWTMVISNGLLALFGIIQFIGANPFATLIATRGVGITRISGTTGDANWLAMLIVIVIPITIYWFIGETVPWKKTLLLWTAIAQILTTTFTYSRMAALGLGLMAIIIMVKQKVKPSTVFAVVGLSAILAPLLPAAYWDRVYSMAFVETDFAISVRLELQKAALKMIVDYPVLGVGVGNFGVNLFRGYLDITKVYGGAIHRVEAFTLTGAHNLYLDTAANMGLLGSGTLIFMIAYGWRELRKFQKFFKQHNNLQMMYLCHGIETSLAVFCFCSIFLHSLATKYFWILFSTIAVIRYIYGSRGINGKKMEKN
ncbi:MAG: O-antigen ligase family protein [bacterium]|nr:O-antigen ligase family protein [bacterium]